MAWIELSVTFVVFWCVPVVVRDVEPAVELRAAASIADDSIVIELRHGRLLRLPGSVTAKRLAELIQALDAESAR